MTTALPSLTQAQGLAALAETRAAAPRPRRAPWFLRALPAALYLAFLAYMFIGVMPMSDASAITSGDGNSTERLAVLAMTGIALFEIVRRRRVVLPS